MAGHLHVTRYSQRWQCETVDSMLKRLLGSALRARSYWSQTRELHLRVRTHNVMILRRPELFYGAFLTPFIFGGRAIITSMEIPSNHRLYGQHLKLWMPLLSNLLGWSAARVERWASQYKIQIEDENSDFYHERPEYYVANLLLPFDAWKMLGMHKCCKLTNDLERALTGNDLKKDQFALADISKIRTLVEEVLHENGYSLSQVAKERMNWRSSQEPQS
jgi:hypothetical protein